MDRADTRLAVQVCYSPAPRQVELVELRLPTGSTVADAVQASGLLERHSLAPEAIAAGIWGRRQPLSQRLGEGDRVEIYRALALDPKVARRLRDKSQRKEKRPVKAGR
jgi:putative ubiquitin-RnfH superfamily antitoxin RatB of RatAB toxin-antitoxin module